MILNGRELTSWLFLRYTPFGMSIVGLLEEPVLSVNVTFEPIHVCSTKRSLALGVSGKAEIVVCGRGTIHSAVRSFEIPSVIKLSHMVRRPRARVALSKREILRRTDYTCQYCGRKISHLTLHHVVHRNYGEPTK